MEVNVFGNVENNVKKDQEVLDDIQRVIQTCGMGDARKSREEEALAKVSRPLHLQESFYKEKASNNWLQLGDMCIKVFHLEASIKASRKNISAMMIDGMLIEDEDQIIDHTMKYFEDLYKCRERVDINQISNVITTAIQEQHNVCLTSLPSKKEIYSAVCSLSSSSSPGPEGFESGF